MRTSLKSSVAAAMCITAMLAGGAPGRAVAATVFLNPGDNIQAKVNANPGTTTFKFNAGVYNNQSVTPKSNNVFDGQNIATMDGKNSTQKAFVAIAGRSNVTIKNLTIKNYRPPVQQAAVDCELGNAWLIQNNIIRASREVGVNFGPNTQVLDNDIINNGLAGFSGSGSGWLVENNQINNNNTRHLDWHFEGGGGKVTENGGGTFRGNVCNGNDGPGIWLDIDANNILIEENTCSNNLAPGIMFEISSNVTIRNNTCKHNGEASEDWQSAQILISSADEATVYGNIIDAPAGHFGIFVNSQEGREYDGINNDVYDNDVTLRGTLAQGVHGVDRDGDDRQPNHPVFTTNSFHDNTYHLQSLSWKYFQWFDLNSYTFSQAQANGKEAGSTADTNLPAP